MTSLSPRRHAPPIQMVLVAVAAVSLWASALIAAGPATAAGPLASASRTCAVKWVSGSKKHTVRHPAWVYAKGSKRMVRRLVAFRATCGRHCASTRKVKGKRKVVFVRKRVLVRVPGTVKGVRRLVSVRRTSRVPKTKACPASAKGPEDLGTPVSIVLQDGSAALLDFSSFTRTAALSGAITGYLPSGQGANDFDVKLTGGTLDVAPTAVFVDDACNGQVSASLRLGTGTKVLVDGSKTSSSTVRDGRTVTSVLNVIVRTALEMRNDDTGCDKPYISTGYTDTPLKLVLAGTYDGGKMSLKSAQTILDLDACITPGSPAEPCNGFAIPLPILISNTVSAELQIG